MITIYRIARAELQTLFYSPVAWLILIVFAVQAGFNFTTVFGSYLFTQEEGNQLSNLTYNFYMRQSGLFNAVQKYLYFYIPLLTMGLMSRELSSGSVKLLYCSPITNTQIIFGKFFSMMIFGLMLMGILFVYILFGMCTIQQFDIPAVFSGLLGLYLLMCAYAAIGLFTSSLTSYQVVAAIGTFIILSALNMVGRLWQHLDFVRDITYWLNMGGRANEFIEGLICSEDVFYFLILIALFLSLTILRLKAIRQKIPWILAFGKYVAVFVLAMMLGYLTSRPVFMAYYDATYTKNNSLTLNSQEIVKKMTGGLTMTTYVNLLDPLARHAVPKVRNWDMREFRAYVRFKPEMKIRYVYYYDQIQNDYLDRVHAGLTDRQKMIKVAELEKIDTNRVKRPEEIRQIIDLAPEKNRLVRVLERENGERNFLRMFNDMQQYPGEAEITAAFKRMVMDLPVVGFLKGHGERSSVVDGNRDYSSFAQERTFRYALINQGFDHREVTLDREIPEEITILVIADIKKPLTAEEQQWFDRYIERGGNLLIAGEPRNRLYINALIEPLGVQLMPGYIVKPSEDFSPDLVMSRMVPEAVHLSRNFNVLLRRRVVITMPGCAGLAYAEDCGFKVIPLLASDSTGSWNEVETIDFVNDTAKLNPACGEMMKSYPTAVALSREIAGREQKIIVLGDADCLSNGEIYMRRNKVSAGNFNMIMGSFFWMSDGEVPIDVSRPVSPDRTIYLSFSCFKVWKIILLWVFPFALLLFYIVVWLRRRGR